MEKLDAHLPHLVHQPRLVGEHAIVRVCCCYPGGEEDEGYKLNKNEILQPSASATSKKKCNEDVKLTKGT